MSLPKGVHVVRRGGKVYYYWRATKTRLPEAFAEMGPDAQQQAIAKAGAARDDAIPPGTMAALIDEYERSPQFLRLADSTKTTYRRCLEMLGRFRRVPVTAMRRKQIIAIRDALAANAPAVANQFSSFCATLFAFAIDREYRDDNPALRIKKLKGGSYARWPEEMISHAMTFREHWRRAVVLALYTGQREGDCCRMTWKQYDGNAIEVVQEKTGTPLWIPVHADLKAELDEWKKTARAVTILVNTRGKLWKPESFRRNFSEMMRSKEEMRGLVFHGLRKAAAARLAEAGCSTHEIAAITGHKTLAMIELYTQAADQKRRASAAIVKLERGGNKGCN
jgi:integrase